MADVKNDLMLRMCKNYLVLKKGFDVFLKMYKNLFPPTRQ
jgi:hypothetical protein